MANFILWKGDLINLDLVASVTQVHTRAGTVKLHLSGAGVVELHGLTSELWEKLLTAVDADRWDDSKIEHPQKLPPAS